MCFFWCSDLVLSNSWWSQSLLNVLMQFSRYILSQCVQMNDRSTSFAWDRKLDKKCGSVVLLGLWRIGYLGTAQRNTWLMTITSVIPCFIMSSFCFEVIFLLGYSEIMYICQVPTVLNEWRWQRNKERKERRAYLLLVLRRFDDLNIWISWLEECYNILKRNCTKIVN